MLRRPLPLLTRLRRHRGWFALAFAVLLIKLVSSSVCLGDRAPLLAASAPAGTTVAATADEQAGELCLLGEGADCHCACAHSLTVTRTGVIAAVPAAPATARGGLAVPEHLPVFSGSLLRPPIA